MHTATIIQLLQKVEIFNDLPLPLLEQFAERLKIHSLPADTEIIRKGDEGDTMFVIATGKVKIHDGEHVVATMQDGNFFGEFSLLDSAPRSMSVTSVTDVTILPIKREIFYGLLQSQPEIAIRVVSTLTRRLRTQNESIIKQLKTREEELSRLVDERTIELKNKNEEITIKNKEITDNVNYAKRIQSAILPDDGKIKNAFPKSFVLYLPKDIVSGDFYSFFHQGNNATIIAADCTGHGVTGAFLSVVGHSILNQIIGEKKISDPGMILDMLNEEIIITLNQRNGESTDGMDLAICCLDLQKNVLKYAGANRPLWIVRDGEIIIYQADKFPVGGLQILHDENFHSHTIQLMKNDTFYIFSDGYADQFGGDAGKKLLTKKLKEILLSLVQTEMDDQKKHLHDYFDKWKRDNEQVDDVLVIGIRV